MEKPILNQNVGLSDADTIKKLKAILVKEKKQAKDNVKTIQELQDQIQIKETENNNLVEQITRLSSNIDIDKDNENYRNLYSKLNTDIDKFVSEAMTTIKSLVNNSKYELKLMLEQHNDNFEYSKAFNDILKFIYETNKQFESSSVLKDGLDLITNQNYDLEEKLQSQISQIRQLEEIIEESRNISRDLEKERDQLQNELVDFRQRSEEKECYLADECKEIRREYDSYKNKTDENILKLKEEIRSLEKQLNVNYVTSNEVISHLPEKEFSDKSKILDEIKAVFENCETFGDLIRHIECLKEENERLKHKYQNETEFNDLISLIKENLNESNCNNNTEIISELFSRYLEQIKSFESLTNNSIILKSNIDEILIRINEIESQKELNANKVEELTEKISLLKEAAELERTNFFKEQESFKKELENVQKSSNKNDLMDLEMAEIDKTLRNLNSSVKEKSEKINSLENQLKELQLNNTELENKSSNLESRNNKMKQMLVKTKKELTEKCCEFDALNNNYSNKQSEIEKLTNELELTKLDLIESCKKTEEYCNKLKEQKYRFENLIKSKDIKINSIQEKIENKTKMFDDLQEEFNAYKIKVHAAFNNSQNQTKPKFSSYTSNEINSIDNAPNSPTKITDNNQDQILNRTIQQYETKIKELEEDIDELKLENQSFEDRVTNLNEETEMYRRDNEQWIDKYKVVCKEKSDLNLKLTSCLDRLREESRTSKSNNSDLLEQFNQEKHKLNLYFQSQLESNKQEYEIKLNQINNRLNHLENVNLQLEKEKYQYQDQLQLLEAKLEVQQTYPPTNLNIEHNPKIFAWNAPIELERQQGEGMESSQFDPHDTSSSSIEMSPSGQIVSPKMQIQKKFINGLVPLEELINQKNLNKKQSGDWENDIDNEDDRVKLLHRSINSYKIQMENMKELLNDSEDTVEHLRKQIDILKSEVRRLENNQEREKKLNDAKSCEYLKNILLRFLQTNSSVLDERDQLIPVLSTLLHLTNDEKEVLQQFVQFTSGLDSNLMTSNNSDSNNDRSGNSNTWSNYFTWSGFSN